MSDFPASKGLRSLLPASPVRWFWTRLRIYLAVAAGVTVVCLSVAAYQAIEPADRPAVWTISSSIISSVTVLIYVTLRLVRTEAFSHGFSGLVHSLSLLLGLGGGHKSRD